VLYAECLAVAGFVHSFGTRETGSLATEPSGIRADAERFARVSGFEAGRFYEVSQVHGARVVQVLATDVPAFVRRGEGADALATGVPGHAVGIRTADCVPVLLADPRSGRVAVAHAGWRGVVAGVVTRAALAVGVPTERLVAAIGPSIGPCCFEVGEDVAVQIATATRPAVRLDRTGQRPRVDLWLAVEHQLRALHIATVDTLGRCTVCEPELFFSYRRDGARAGRQWSAIAARSPGAHA